MARFLGGHGNPHPLPAPWHHGAILGVLHAGVKREAIVLRLDTISGADSKVGRVFFGICKLPMWESSIRIGYRMRVQRPLLEFGEWLGFGMRAKRGLSNIFFELSDINNSIFLNYESSALTN